jgi:mono/diheme cytochrome c family protein
LIKGAYFVKSTTLLAAAILLAAAALPAWADPARDALLADYAAQAKAADPTFSGFSAARGQSLYVTKHAEAAPETPACLSCHGEDPRQPGQNAKTGKVIEPMAVSANAKRFTVKDDVEKWFGRNCKAVLGRDCSPAEKGDYITFLSAR